MNQINKILDALDEIKISKVMNEHQIHQEIKKALDRNNISYKHEYKLLSHKRFDFWINGIVLEVKKRKPTKINILNQLDRYTKVPDVKAVIVVLERNVSILEELNGKPIYIKSLNQNWGIAL